MRMLVVGAGATGGYFGARLAAAGRDVTFSVWPARAAALRATGLRIVSPKGDVTVAPGIVETGRVDGRYDAVLLAVKAFSQEQALADVAPADETVAIVRAAGTAPSDAFVTAARSQLTAAGSGSTSSVFRDLHRQVKLEADQIIGDLLRRGERDGVPAPLLSAAYTHLAVYEVQRAAA